MASRMSRRAILAGTAALPTLAATAMMGDQIFQAIENHKAAVLIELRAGEVYSCMSCDHPNYEAAEAADNEAAEAADDVAFELANIIPTTMAGVIALLAYVRDFNAGKVALPSGDWHSIREMWPTIEFDDGKSECAPYVLMENALSALQTLQERSVS